MRTKFVVVMPVPSPGLYEWGSSWHKNSVGYCPHHHHHHHHTHPHPHTHTHTPHTPHTHPRARPSGRTSGARAAPSEPPTPSAAIRFTPSRRSLLALSHVRGQGDGAALCSGLAVLRSLTLKHLPMQATSLNDQKPGVWFLSQWKPACRAHAGKSGTLVSHDPRARALAARQRMATTPTPTPTPTPTHGAICLRSGSRTVDWVRQREARFQAKLHWATAMATTRHLAQPQSPGEFTWVGGRGRVALWARQPRLCPTFPHGGRQSIPNGDRTVCFFSSGANDVSFNQW